MNVHGRDFSNEENLDISSVIVHKIILGSPAFKHLLCAYVNLLQKLLLKLFLRQTFCHSVVEN